MKKILIVEDDKFLVNAYQAKFSKIENIKINVAYDGVEALKSIKTDKPDVIILDLVLPNMDGFEVMKILKEQKINIPIMVASNLGSKNDIERAMELNASTYFVKSDTSIKEITDEAVKMTKK